VDKAVRNTFQLAPEHIQITNPSWTSQLAELTKEVCCTLGVQANLTVEAKLYKMLLYEKGSHFKPHRDSEKEHGMFGTMVIVLPSHFEGGELIVKHKGEVETFDQSSVFSSHYAGRCGCGLRTAKQFTNFRMSKHFQRCMQIADTSSRRSQADIVCASCTT